jgi:diamine N-acetyltransferase
MPQPLFRLASPGDAEALTELMTRTFRETYSERLFGICRDADVEHYVAEHFSLDRQRAEIADPGMRTILAELDGTLVGYAQLRFDAPPPFGAPIARPVEVARFYVDRPWHGRGVAGALMRAAVGVADGADLVWLGVFEHNERARAFYAKCGFVPIGRTTFRMGDDVQDDWVLALTPPSSMDR